MFTGIVQAALPFTIVNQQENILTYAVKFSPELLLNLKLGASVSVSGVCQTVKQIDSDSGLVYFDAIAETLKLTNLKLFKTGDLVNIERSLKFGDEVGGHVLSGHIIDTVKICNISKKNSNVVITFECNKNLLKYIFHKGYVALDGCSLTVVEPRLNPENINTALFDICLIPETLRITTFGSKIIGDLINLEIDNQTQIIVNTVENYLVLHHK
jgi:riboflavin synthase